MAAIEEATQEVKIVGEKHKEIYAEQAEAYDRLVSCEDWEGHLLPAIQKIAHLEQAHIVELGAGTGRLTRLLAPHVGSIQAFDQAQAMCDVAAKHMQTEGHAHVVLAVADNAHLPVASGCADLVIAGWSVCYSVTWGGDRWQALVDGILQEMQRVCRDGGVCVLIETLGTGHETPHPPDALVPYYAHLESTLGWQHCWIRTDYRFADTKEAATLLRFFFGEERAAQVLALHRASGAGDDEAVFFPECTGIWWQHC